MSISRQLLDTDILSEVIEGRDATVAERASAYLEAEGTFTTSAVTVAEVVYGFRLMAREDRIAAFEASLVNVEVLPFNVRSFFDRDDPAVPQQAIGNPGFNPEAFALPHSSLPCLSS